MTRPDHRMQRLRTVETSVTLPDAHVSARRQATSFDRDTVTSLVLLSWWVIQMAPQIGPIAGLFSSGSAGVSAVSAVSATEEGSLSNAVLVLVYAALGLWHLPRALASRRNNGALGALLVLLGLYMAWAFTSLLWSVDLALTVRRFVEFALLAIGSFGLGAGFYAQSDNVPDRLMRHALWAGASAVGVLWIGLLTTTGIDLLNPAWSAKVFGTAIAHPVAFSLFSMVYLHRQHRVRAWWLWAYLIAGLLTLFAEKARFIIGYTVVVLILLWLTRARLQRILHWILAVGFVVCTTLAVAATQNTDGLMNAAWSYATLDTGADLGELSGRTELWTELQNYVADKPWLGYGFGAFWNPGQLVHIRDVIRWSPVVAHNGFLDEVLATGLIGAALAVMFWVTGLWLSIQRARRGRDTDFAAVVVCWIVLFLLFNWGDSLMQLYFRFPFYAALAGLFAVVARPVGDTNVRMNFTAS